MKTILLVSCLATLQVCLCRPQQPQQLPVQAQVQQVHPQVQHLQSGSEVTPVPIVSFTESVGHDGQFNYSYETGNGIKVNEVGVLKHITGVRARGGFSDPNVPDEEDIVVRTGSFSYTAPDGQVISLSYTADENGFQPVGDHLPTPPAIPADIQRSLENIPRGTEPPPALIHA